MSAASRAISQIPRLRALVTKIRTGSLGPIVKSRRLGDGWATNLHWHPSWIAEDAPPVASGREAPVSRSGRPRAKLADSGQLQFHQKEVFVFAIIVPAEGVADDMVDGAAHSRRDHGLNEVDVI